MQSLRAQNDTLNQRLSAADSSNAALQSGLDKSWQSARAADRAAQEAKQQLAQAQQQIMQLRQQLQQQGIAGTLPVLPAFGSSGLLPAPVQPALSSPSWSAADSYGLGSAIPLSASIAVDNIRPRYESTTFHAGSVYASQDWQQQGRSLAASADAAPWGSTTQQQQPGGFNSLSNSPSATDRPPVPRLGLSQQQQQQQDPAVSRPADPCPWFAGGGSRVGSSQQISSHMHGGAGAAGSLGSPAAQGTAIPQAPSQQHEQRPESRQQQQQPGGLAAQSSTADLQGYSGSSSSSALSRDMMSVVEIMSATKQAEEQLLGLCQERDELEKELAKMPAGAGRTIRGRQRKVVVETRLEELGVQISKIRTHIKQLNGNIKR